MIIRDLITDAIDLCREPLIWVIAAVLILLEVAK